MKPDLTPKDARGFALIVVLLVLALITGMVISLMSVATSEHANSVALSSAAGALRLTDLPIQLVEAQIRDATLDGNGNYSWASQPGMIRTYDSSGTESEGSVTGFGKLQHAFKLYSSATSVVSGSYDPTDDWAPSSWDSSPALYTDLNSPVSDPTVTNKFYPIFDPTVATSVTVTDGIPTPPDTTTTTVDGAYYNGTAAPIAGKSNQAAMPVPWLYVLSDGEVVAPDPGSSETSLTFGTAKVAPGGTFTSNGVTLTNEIVGRIAYWTDDETCKLNLNTASEGIPWEVPSFGDVTSLANSMYQPSAYEYQRIPAHPASVCLSPALGLFFNLPSTTVLAPVPNSQKTYHLGGTTAVSDPTPTFPTQYSQTIFNAIFGLSNYAPAIAPRTVTADTGSKMGTLNTAYDATSSGILSNKLTVNRNRLYASVDELAFIPPKSGGGASADYTRSTTYSGTTLTPNQVAQLRFFLTTNSQSPEVNLFHQPRVSLWPIPDVNNTSPITASSYNVPFKINQRSPLDQLMAFCTTTNANSSTPYTYYFTRYDPTSTTNDWTNIPRNPKLWKYLRTFLGSSIPGYGNSFSSRTDMGSKACDELVTLFFDYIRGCVNLVDSSNPGTGQSQQPVPSTSFLAGSPPSGFYVGNESKWFSSSYTVPPVFCQPASGDYPYACAMPGTGQVVPIVPPSSGTNGTATKGLGRFPTLQTVSLMFVADYANQPPVYCNGTGVPYWNNGNQKNKFAGTDTVFSYINRQELGGTNPITPAPPLSPMQLTGTVSYLRAGLTSLGLANGMGIPPGVPALTPQQIYYILQLAKPNPLHPFCNTQEKEYEYTNAKGPYFKVLGNTIGHTGTTYTPAGTNIPFWTWGLPFSYLTNALTSSALLSLPSTFGTDYNSATGTISYTDEYPSFIYSGALTTYAGVPCISSTATPVGYTHPGLATLPIMDAVTGAFDLPNTNCTAPAAAALQTKFHTTIMEAAVLPQLVNLAPGTPAMGPSFEIDINGNITANGTPIALGGDSVSLEGFQAMNPTTNTDYGLPNNVTDNSTANSSFSIAPAFSLFGPHQSLGPMYKTTGAGSTGGTSTFHAYTGVPDPTDPNGKITGGYFTITPGTTPGADLVGGSFPLGASTFTLTLKYLPPSNSSMVATNLTTDAKAAAQARSVVQTINLTFPPATVPTPKLAPIMRLAAKYGFNTATTVPWSPEGPALTPSTTGLGALPFYIPSTIDSIAAMTTYSYRNSFAPAWLFPPEDAGGNSPSYYFNYTSNGSTGGSYEAYPDYYAIKNQITPFSYIPCSTFRTLECAYGDPRVGACYPAINDTAGNYAPTYSKDLPGQVGYSSAANIFIPQSYYYGPASVNDTGANYTNTFYLRGGTPFRGLGAFPYGVSTGTAYRSSNDGVLNSSAVYGYGVSGGTLGFPAPNGFGYTQYADGGTAEPYSALTNGSYIMGNSTLYPLDSWVPNGLFFAFPYVTSTFDLTQESDTGYFVNNVWNLGGDLDNGLYAGGPYINKPDEGSVNTNPSNFAVTSDTPYWIDPSLLPGQTLFYPNRQMPSAVMFGSLPVGIDPTVQNPLKAWKTLQFCPNPNKSQASTRVTQTNPPDYLLLDLFQMPVVQPYALSGPLYSSGKVNMNYQIVPFSYIYRSTAMRGLLKAKGFSAVPDSDIAVYEGTTANTGTGAQGKDRIIGNCMMTNPARTVPSIAGTTGTTANYYYPIHLNETLKQFDYQFYTNKDLFHSPSEICRLWLYPATQPSASSSSTATPLVAWNATNSAISSWWYDKAGTARKGETGDNTRERPYAEIYPLLTTQSNSYTVHYRVQVLKKNKNTSAATWVEPGSAGTTDTIVSDYRGCSLIERYIDPNDPSLPDFASVGLPEGNVQSTADYYYKFRTVSSRRFAP